MDKQILLDWLDGSRWGSNHPFANTAWHRQTHLLGIVCYYRAKGLQLVWDRRRRALVIDTAR